MGTIAHQRYDFRDHLDLLGTIVEKAKAEMTQEQRVTIQAACRNQRLNRRVQVTPFAEDQPTMTMGELSAIGQLDPGVQRIDPKAIERLLFGDYGMIKAKKRKDKTAVGKIGERPLIVYFQSDLDDSPKDPANASGRHRNFAWQILGHAADVSWEELMQQPMWVDKTVCVTKDEFSMIMSLANGQQARKQPAIELKSFDLTKKMISIDDVQNLVTTRVNASQGQFADVIATGTVMALPGTYTGDTSFIWDRVKSAWTKAVRVSLENKKEMIKVFKEDGDKIKALIYHLGENVVEIVDAEAERTSSKTLNTRVSERITDSICDFFGVQRGLWETDAQNARKQLEQLAQRQARLSVHA